MEVFSHDTVATLTERAMKGMDTHQRQLIYSAFISDISQQLLQWTLTLFGEIQDMQGMQKDNHAMEKELKGKLVQACKVIDGQTKQLEEKDAEIKRLQHVIEQMEEDKIKRPPPVDPMDARWVQKEMKRLRERNEQLEGLSIMYALEDNSDSHVVEIHNAASVDDPDYAEDTDEDEAAFGEAREQDQDPFEVIQSLKVELHYANARAEKFEKMSKSSGHESTLNDAKRDALQTELEKQSKAYAALEKNMSVLEKTRWEETKALQEKIENLKATHEAEIHASDEQRRAELRQQTERHQAELNAVNDELDGVQLANQMMAKQKGRPVMVHCTAQTDQVETKDAETALEKVVLSHCSTQTKSIHSSSGGAGSVAGGGEGTNGIDATTLARFKREHQDAVDKAVMESANAQKKILQERFQKEIVKLSREAEEAKEKAVQAVTERLTAQHRAEMAVANKLAGSNSSRKSVKKEKKERRKPSKNVSSTSLQGTDAMEPGSEAGGHSSSTLTTDSALDNGPTPHATGESLPSRTDAGQTPQGGASEEDSGGSTSADSEADEEAREQFKKQQSKVQSARADIENGSGGGPKFSMQAKQKIAQLMERVDNAEREKKEAMKKYDATIAVLTDMDESITSLRSQLEETRTEMTKEKKTLRDTINEWRAKYHGVKTEMKVESDQWADKYHALETEKELARVNALKEKGTMVLIEKAHCMHLIAVYVAKRQIIRAFRRWLGRTIEHRRSEHILWQRTVRYAEKKKARAFKQWLAHMLHGRAVAFAQEKEKMRIEFWKQQAELQRNWSKTSADTVKRAVDRESKSSMYDNEVKLQRAIQAAKSELDAEWNKERAARALKFAELRSASIERESKHRQEIARLHVQSKLNWPEPPKALYDGKDRLFESIRENLALLKHDIAVAMDENDDATTGH